MEGTGFVSVLSWVEKTLSQTHTQPTKMLGVVEILPGKCRKSDTVIVHKADWGEQLIAK